MIAVDGSPLAFGPHSVARMLVGWLAGWPGVAEPDGPLLLLPEGTPAPDVPGLRVRRTERPVRGARRFRALLAGHVVASGARGLLVPWMAVPDLRAFDCPVVATVHELPFVRHGPIEGRWRRRRQRAWLRRDVERCAAVLTPSRATRDDVLAAAPRLADRLHVVPHGFDPRPWAAAAGAPADPPYALMLGVGADRAHARKKGLDVLLAAWRDAAPPGWALHLVGRPALPVPAGVHVHAPVRGAALHGLVARASLLVYPSRSEGFGFPPLEAMAAGVPVLATDAGSLPEVVGEAAACVPAGDVAALAEALRALAGDPARRAALVAAGRARAEAFPVAAAGEAIVGVFAALGVRA